MPRTKITWVLLARDLSLYYSDMLLESLKDYAVSKSGLSPCSLCTEATPHNTRTRLLLCKCKACKTVAPDACCPWKGMVQTCILSNVPQPMSIYNGIIRRFQFYEAAMPKVATVQCFVQHYRRAYLGGSDFLDDVEAKVCEHAHQGDEEPSKPFTFTWRSDANGKPIAGCGSDADAFVVGMSSKQLLHRLDRDRSAHVLHLDATYKLSQVEYPVMQTEHHFAEALAMLRRMYTMVMNKQLSVRFVMADADKAQRNAVDSVLGVDNDIVNLICYFHVAAKIYKHTRGVPIVLAARVARDLADTHLLPSSRALNHAA
ncbi:hypothetical protein PF008_g364 [Phytophthora fragariae]|uniref:MULE transposase domain-containing protein n=1 Tax=Phytophthora fragariae TaxID=53985 RepID=A0A6G0SNE2_9STRA|nr:hypothetical protein PF008_g364 [Phytophthora fragariae]